MKLNQKQIWQICGAILVILIIIGVGVLLNRHRAQVMQEAQGNEGVQGIGETQGTGSTTVGLNPSIPGATITINGQSSTSTQVTKVAPSGGTSTSTIVLPDLNRPLTITAPNLDAQAVANIEGQIVQNTTSLKANANQPVLWLALAQEREFIGDYTGAGQIWIYLTQVSPQDVTSYLNLGDLNASYYKNYPAAESYYLEALSIDPANDTAYRALYEMYRYVYKQSTTAAPSILLTGIQKNPTNAKLDIDLESLLASYYQGIGDKTDAITYLNKALQAAQSIGDQTTAAQIQAQINGLQ